MLDSLGTPESKLGSLTKQCKPDSDPPNSRQKAQALQIENRGSLTITAFREEYLHRPRLCHDLSTAELSSAPQMEASPKYHDLRQQSGQIKYHLISCMFHGAIQLRFPNRRSRFKNRGSAPWHVVEVSAAGPEKP